MSATAQLSNPRPVVAVILGTRPEAIKLVPVVRELQRHDKVLDTVIVSTGQHRAMLDQVTDLFKISVHYDMSLMVPGQSLYQLSSKAILAFEGVFTRFQPNLLIVQGDTTTAFIGSLAAHYARLPVAHVEAGLRTNNRLFPFPEEINRRLVSVMTELHFAPTKGNRQNLLREGVSSDRIFVTGNTAIDMLLSTLELHRRPTKKLPSLDGRRLVLVTVHRREIFGEEIREIFHAVQDLAAAMPDVLILFPAHLNPNVREPAREILGNSSNIMLTEPLEYFDFVHAMSRAHLILTDSGGIQEEAPTLGVRVLVLRNQTERLEGLESTVVELVGTNRSAIVKQAIRALSAREISRTPSVTNPYGDGKASARIAKQILRFLNIPDHGVYDGIGEFCSDARSAITTSG